MKITSRKFLVRSGAAIVLAATLALTGCTPLTPPEFEDQTVVGLTFIPNIQFAPFYNADSEGFFTSDVSFYLRHHGVGEGLFTALAAGEEDFVVAGGDEILQARSQGIDIVAVAAYYTEYPVRIIVPEDSDIYTVADLRGHNIGFPGQFGENWFALLIALKEAGLTQEDLTLSEIGYTNLPSLTTGKVDAVVGFANSDVINFETAGFPVRVIDPAVPLVSICLATTQAYADANPQIVRIVIDGMKKGMVTASNDPELTLTIAADYIPSFRDEVLAMAEVVLPATAQLFLGTDGVTISPQFDPAQWTAMAQAMASVGLIPEGTDPTLAFTNQYATS